MKIISGLFLGILFLVIGIILLINSIFNLHVQTFKLIIGIFIVVTGIFILFNGFGFRDTTNIIFSERIIRVERGAEEYNVIFGSGVIDLSKMEFDTSIKPVKINVIFANADILLSENLPTIIHANAAFGALELGNDSTGIFSSKKYKIGNINESEGYLEIEANSVFGRLRFAITD